MVYDTLRAVLEAHTKKSQTQTSQFRTWAWGSALHLAPYPSPHQVTLDARKFEHNCLKGLECFHLLKLI